MHIINVVTLHIGAEDPLHKNAKNTTNQQIYLCYFPLMI